VRDRVQSALGKEPVLHCYADEHMIGGIKLRIGDQLIDGSVRTQLRRMRAGLLSSRGELRDRVSRIIEDTD
jgi:F-type H+-transporting ATPase subunit delta